MKYFFIGIKGTGMSALASILKDEGHIVEGIDVDDYVFTENILKLKGIFIHPYNYRSFTAKYIYIIGHNFMKSDLFEQIKNNNFHYFEYHLFLRYYMRNKFTVAVSGTHGKTTTTGLFAHMFFDEPVSYLIGDGTGHGNVNSKFFVFEACEYQDHFLVYNPKAIIITNIDYDHSDYFKNVEQYIKSFQSFIKEADVIFILYDDKDKINHHNVITYGLNKEANCCCLEHKCEKNGQKGTIFVNNHYYEFFLPLFGEHNINHLLSIVAFLDYYHLDVNYYLQKLATFTGVKRRMVRTLINDDVFIDDYAHHPNEIISSINAVREMHPSHKVIAIFKPDRYSRLLTFKDEFINALNYGDKSYVLPLYEANRYQGSRILCDEKSIFYVDDEKEFENIVFPLENCVFLFMSSKDLSKEMKAIVKKRENKH